MVLERQMQMENFTITISPALTDNNKANITAIDSAGNKSEVLDIIGTKDTTPPDKPIFNRVDNDNGTNVKVITANSETDDSTPKFTVKVEHNATLTIYDNGVAISALTVGQVDANSYWSFTLDKNLSYWETYDYFNSERCGRFYQ